MNRWTAVMRKATCSRAGGFKMLFLYRRHSRLAGGGHGLCSQVVRSSIHLLTNLWTPWACSTAHRSNMPHHWDGVMLDRSAASLSSRTKWQWLSACNTLRSVSPAGNHCHFILLDKNESSPTADLSNIGIPNGPAYLSCELLNTPHILEISEVVLMQIGTDSRWSKEF